jgi:threonine/homoserine/homoserine lactone efflux protein
MDRFQQDLITLLIGLAVGFGVCVPVGPINATIVKEGARRGFKWALLIGLGATFMEVIYCAMAFASFAAFFTSDNVRAVMELGSFCLMFFLGLKYLLAPGVPKEPHSAEVVQEKLHPHSAFMIGFVRTMGNLGILPFWIAIAVVFAQRGYVQPTLESKGLFIGGVTLGVSLWFVLLAYVVGQLRKRLTERTLIATIRVSGAMMLVWAGFIAVRIVKLLAQRTG